MPHRIVTRHKDLEDFCKACEGTPYITVDTEFLREKTYFPQLCLLQIGKPETENSKELAIAVDPLSNDINLDCLKNIFFDPNIVKVFHAARQDLEIMMQLFDGKIPSPIFDTQVASMVAGYGDQIGYQSLVKQICNVELDKSHQYTNWSKRPLSSDQVDYALADVTHLRKIYETLQDQLQKEDRESWVKEEMENLCDPETIQTVPEKAWQRVKVRSDKPKVLIVLKELAAWREKEAVIKDRPKHFIMRDEVLGELAKHAPKKEKQLDNIRGMPEKFKSGVHANTILQLISTALSRPKEEWPKKERKIGLPQDLIPGLELLKMLLKIQASEHKVVPRLIASASDLEEFIKKPSIEEAIIFKGWRNEVFGKYAKDLIEEKLALKLENKKIIKQYT